MQGRGFIKFLSIGFVVVVFVLALFICGRIENTYSAECVVVEVGQGTVIVKDSTGEEWEYFGEAEEGEKVKVWFDDKGTKERQDDEIKKVKKF